MAIGAGLAAIGGFITAGLAGGIVAAAIGGAVVGAVVGGLVSAVTGGDIGKGILFGAIGGAVLGGVAGFAGGLGTTMGPMIEGVGQVATTSQTAGLAAAEAAITGGAPGGGIIAQGALSTGVLAGEGITSGQALLASTAAQGIKGYAESEAAGEAAEMAATEAALNRQAQSEALDKQLAAQMSIAQMQEGPQFWLKEKTELRKTETGERIKEYDARVATDLATRREVSGRAAKGVLDLKLKGRVMEAPKAEEAIG